MNKVQFVDADKIKTLDQYGVSLLTCMISLRSLEQYQIAAMSQGILQEDEEEMCKTICWELRRLMQLFAKQYEQINERCPIDGNDMLNTLKSLMADLKKPRKKKNG